MMLCVSRGRLGWTAGLLLLGLATLGCKTRLNLPSPLGAAASPTEASLGEGKWQEHMLGMPYVVGYAAGMQQAAAEDKPAMVLLTTTWCKWCKKLAKETLADPQIEPILREHFVLVLVDGDTEPAVKEQWNSSGYPHVLFLSPEEELLAERKGFATVSEFQALLAGMRPSGASS